MQVKLLFCLCLIGTIQPPKCSDTIFCLALEVCFQKPVPTLANLQIIVYRVNVLLS